jgi:hypothetical protein
MRSGAAVRTSASPAAGSRTSSGRPARRSPRTVSPPTGEGRIGATVVRPGLTSVRQPLEAVAERVIEVLLDHLSGSRTDPARVLLDPALVVRDSSDRAADPWCGPPPVPEGEARPPE